MIACRQMSLRKVINKKLKKLTKGMFVLAQDDISGIRRHLLIQKSGACK